MRLRTPDISEDTSSAAFNCRHFFALVLKSDSHREFSSRATSPLLAWGCEVAAELHSREATVKDLLACRGYPNTTWNLHLDVLLNAAAMVAVSWLRPGQAKGLNQN